MKLKTFTRMIRRYVLATAAVVLLVVGLLLGLTVYLGLHYGETSDDRARIGTLAEALTPAADGLQLTPPRRRPVDAGLRGPWCWMRTARSSGSTTCRKI